MKSKIILKNHVAILTNKSLTIVDNVTALCLYDQMDTNTICMSLEDAAQLLAFLEEHKDQILEVNR